MILAEEVVAVLLAEEVLLVLRSTNLPVVPPTLLHTGSLLTGVLLMILRLEVTLTALSSLLLWMVGVTVVTWLTLLPRIMRMFSLFLSPPPQYTCSSLEDDAVVLLLLVEGPVVVPGGKENGDQAVLLVPVSSTPAVVHGLVTS